MRNNFNPLPLELKKFGLTSKEAEAYLTLLETGYTSAQDLAEKIRVSRPTAYEIIKKLKEKNLIKENKEKIKKYFSAQSPDNLFKIIRIAKKELEEKERELTRIIAVLRGKYYLNKEKNIKTYYGKTGFETLFDEFLTTLSKEIYLFITDKKILNDKQRIKAYQKIKKRLGSIKIKEISLTKSKSNISLPYLETKNFPLIAEIIKFKGVGIITEKVIIFSSNKTHFSLENEEIINFIKTLFLLLFEKN